MLVLSRKLKESLVIDGVGTISVQKISSGRVRLGLEIDNHFHVRRGELVPKAKPESEGSSGSRHSTN